jgi:hypothetical protein
MNLSRVSEMPDTTNEQNPTLEAVISALREYIMSPKGEDDFLPEFVKQYSRDLVLNELAHFFNTQNPKLQLNDFPDYAKAMIALGYKLLRNTNKYHKFRDAISLVNEVSDHDLIDLLEDNGQRGAFVVDLARRMEKSESLAEFIFKKIEDSYQKPGAWLAGSIETKHSVSLIKNLIKQRDGSKGALRLISPREIVTENLPMVDRLEVLQFMMDEIDNPAESFNGGGAPFLLLTSAIKGLIGCQSNELKAKHIDCIYLYAEKMHNNLDQFKSHLQIIPTLKANIFEGINSIIDPLVKSLIETKTPSKDFYKLLAAMTVFNNNDLKIEATKDDGPFAIVTKLLDKPNYQITAALRSYAVHEPLSADEVVNNVTKTWHLSMVEVLFDIEKLKRIGNRRFNGVVLSDQLGL